MLTILISIYETQLPEDLSEFLKKTSDFLFQPSKVECLNNAIATSFIKLYHIIPFKLLEYFISIIVIIKKGKNSKSLKGFAGFICNEIYFHIHTICRIIVELRY